MKLLIKCLSLLLFITIGVAQLNTVGLVDDIISDIGGVSRSATGPDLFTAGGKYIAFIVSSGFPGYGVKVFEKDNEGKYSIEQDIGFLTQPIGWFEVFTTNGKWFGAYSTADSLVRMFRANETGTFSPIADSFSASTQFMHLLSDDTLLLISDSAIQIYEYINDQWKLTVSQYVTFAVTPYFELYYPNPTDSQPHVTDSTLAGFNPSTNNIELYVRYDKSKLWTLVDEVPINTSQFQANRILWNGNDTVVITHTNNYDADGGFYFNRLLILTNASGVWNVTQTFQEGRYLGSRLLLMNPGLIAVSFPDMTGEVRYLFRMGDSWQFTTRFIRSDTESTSRNFFGYAMQRNNDGIVVLSLYIQQVIFAQLIPYSEVCNVTITCPAPTPVALPPVIDSPTIPISSPPMMETVPIVAPIAETKVTSAAGLRTWCVLGWLVFVVTH